MSCIKKCVECGLDLHISAFDPDRRGKDGLRKRCRLCINKAAREAKIWHKKKCPHCKIEKPPEDFHPSASNASGRQSHCKACSIVRQREWGEAARMAVLSHYSQGLLACACCGNNLIETLTIDHIMPGGNEHRKSVGAGSSYQFYAWLIEDGLPLGYQVLCKRCNSSKGTGDKCGCGGKGWGDCEAEPKQCTLTITVTVEVAA